MDPRLLRHAHAARAFIGACVGLGAISGVLVVAQAWLIALVISEAFDGRGLAQLRVALAALLAVVVARAAVAWSAELASGRSSPRVKSQLRSALLHRLAIDPGGASGPGTGAIATLAGRGIDALDAYYSLYLPQLLLAVIVPLLVVVAMLAADWISGVIVAITLPLIPVFMALVGATTRERTAAQMRILERLAGHFLDVASGLPTLKVFGAAKRQTQVITEVADRHRVATLATLRITFLSSLTLELLSTISVAVVAVAVGLRLLAGDLDFRTALFVLVIAPEAYLPLRTLAANYHASAEGVSAAERILGLLAAPAPKRGRGLGVGDLSVAELVVRGGHGQLRGPGGAGTRRRLAAGVARGDRGGDGGQRLREVDVAERDPGIRRPDRRIGPYRRHRSCRPRSRRLAAARRLAPAATASVRGVDRGQHPAGAPRRERRRGAGGRRGRRPRRMLSRDRPGGYRGRDRRRAARCSPQASASASRSRGSSFATLRCCCSTSRQPTWTARPRTRCSTPCTADARPDGDRGRASSGPGGARRQTVVDLTRSRGGPHEARRSGARAPAGFGRSRGGCCCRACSARARWARESGCWRRRRG